MDTALPFGFLWASRSSHYLDHVLKNKKEFNPLSISLYRTCDIFTYVYTYTVYVDQISFLLYVSRIAVRPYHKMYDWKCTIRDKTYLNGLYHL